MNRRNFLLTAAIAPITSPTLAFAQTSDEGLGGRELVVHTVHNAIQKTSPLLIYSGLKTTLGMDPLLVEVAGREPAVEVWDDWNDHDLHQVFGAFTVGTPDVTLGSYRIFDTPDIAHGVHQPVVDEIEGGYLNVGGVRASWMDAGGVGFGSMRLWNVLITGVGETEHQVEQVMFGMVKHLGRAIGAIDQV